jgi:hypothetical protein
MKKLILTLSVAVCLLFSVTVTPVRADEGNGHDAGYVCVESETVHCPPDSAALPQQGVTSGSNTATPVEEDTTLTLLKLVITLILKS